MSTATPSAQSEDAGSPESWLAAHGDALYGFAMLRLNNTHLAEDLVQDTLLAAWTSRDRFAGRASVRTWLTGILKHKVIDHLRSARREVSFDTRGTADEGLDGFESSFDATGHWVERPADWGDPEQVAQNDDLRDALSECIGRLPEKLRTPFVLREVDGMESEAVVETLGISSTNNLWVMLSRGREKVRTCMETAWRGVG